MRRTYLNYNVFACRYPRPGMSSNMLDNRRNILSSIEVKQRLVIDGIADQSFAKNTHGWIENDLALLQKANTQQELDYALSKLQQVGVVSSRNEDKSVREVLDAVLPRYVQTPGELSAYAEYYSSIHVPSEDVSSKVDDPEGQDDKSKKEAS